MYTSGGQDDLFEFSGLPPPDAGTPNPVVLANEHKCALAYETIPDEEWCIAVFSKRAIYFGSPNDEALSGHPLAQRGLKPYGVFEVRQSSWIRQLETRNRVHQFHRPERFETLRHLIITFHDSTFEVVFEAFSCSQWQGAAPDLAGVLAKALSTVASR